MNPSNELTPKVETVNGLPMVSSVELADTFKKEHFAVLTAIQNLQCSQEFRDNNFLASEYTSKQGKEMPQYHMTRDGFTFLAMGFTGAKAAVWKEKYIKAFNLMEAKLKQSAAMVPTTSTEALLVTVQKLVDVEREQRRLAEEQAETKAEVKQLVARLDTQQIDATQARLLHAALDRLGDQYKAHGRPHPYAAANKAFNKRFGLGGYKELLQSKFDEAMDWIKGQADKQRPMTLVPAGRAGRR